MRMITAMLFLMIFGWSWGEDKPVHLFILSGQSNMEMLDEKKYLLPEAKKLFTDGEVVCIKFAKGGEPIRHWVNEWNEIAEKHGVKKPLLKTIRFYPQVIDLYKEALEKHKKFASVTFCWMQGEQDSGEKLSVTYGDSLRQLISNLRRDLQQPDMAVIIGRLSDTMSGGDWMAIRKIQVEIANEDKKGAWVDCDDMNNAIKKDGPKNTLHYTKAGYQLLGQRFARQAKALYDGRKPAENGMPE